MYKNKVFLGGTCNDSLWRKKVIEDLKIDYFNPVVENWNEEAIKIEEDEKNNLCNIKLYIITPFQTGFYSFCEIIDSCYKDKKSKKWYNWLERFSFNFIEELPNYGEFLLLNSFNFAPRKTVFAYMSKEPWKNILFDLGKIKSLNAIGLKVEELGGKYFGNVFLQDEYDKMIEYINNFKG